MHQQLFTSTSHCLSKLKINKSGSFELLTGFSLQLALTACGLGNIIALIGLIHPSSSFDEWLRTLIYNC